MRVVVDHHVDRSGVEVQQCMKLTDTNNSIGLIALIFSVHSALVAPTNETRAHRAQERLLRFRCPSPAWWF